jgi:hypothetical protein
VDSNPSLCSELASVLPPEVRLLETERQGLSEARNIGIAAARSDVVAFLDDDAAADARWLSSLIIAFADDAELLGAGGPVLPRWGAERRWLRDELLWLVGCTYRGHREDAGPIRNPIGCNMAFRRRELVAAGSFATNFGKRGNALETCDETELSRTAPIGSAMCQRRAFSISCRRAGFPGGCSCAARSARGSQRVDSTGCTCALHLDPSAATRVCCSPRQSRGCCSTESAGVIASQ